MTHRISRRRLLQTASFAAAGYWISGTQTWADELNSRSPNEKLNLAVIGCGGRGGGHVNSAATRQNLVALCDVDEVRSARQLAAHPKAAKFADFRVMFDKMHKQIDGVFVATPDHTHAPASVMAMRLGKHVYCEKPLARDISEVRLMAKVAKEARVATQMGNQANSSRGTAQIVALARTGVIGRITEAHAWCPKNFSASARPTETPPVPATLNWDLWLGPAPERPYNPAYLPFSWRGYWDFGTGGLGDMACHIVSPIFWALELGYPTSVSAEGTPAPADIAEGFAKDLTVKYTFAGRGDGVHQQPVTVYWHHGSHIPRVKPIAGFELPSDVKMKDEAMILMGEKGIIFGDRSVGVLAILPKDKFADFEIPTVATPPAHDEDWYIACKGGRKPTSDFDYAARLSETVLLGNVAWKVGQGFKWDGATGTSPDCPAVSQWLHREYRKGWAV